MLINRFHEINSNPFFTKGRIMKIRFFTASILGLFYFCLTCPAVALEGEPYIHDPSTIVECDGRYYTFGTGSGGLISEDGWTWHSGAVRPGGGVAPDTIKIGDRYLVTYADGGGGQHSFRVHTMWTKTLDPESPDFGFEDNIVVVSTDLSSECDAIDSAFLLDPTDGRLWCTYGTYFGFIQIVELDPATGKRVEGNEPKNIAIDCEATAMMYRDGWYYLLATHGTCCTGVTATYNIRVGRSRDVTGPFVDNLGMDMLRGGGKLVISANGRGIGAGHFGHINLGDDVEKFSFHWEADLDRGGRSVLEIRPLLWKDGWPVAGDDFKGGTFEIESEGTGYALEIGVEAVSLAPSRVRQMRGAPGGAGPRGGAGAPGPGAAPRGAGAPGPGAAPRGAGAPGPGAAPRGAGAPGAGAAPARGAGARGGFGGGFGGRGNAGPVTPIPDQDVAEVSQNWPDGNIEVRLNDYMLLAHQKWEITPAPDAGGYLGGPYFKITIAGTDRTLAKTDNDELIALPAFTGGPEQLWRIDQLTDGTYRIMPKVESATLGPVALIAAGVTTPSLAKFDPESDRGRWNLRKP